LKRIDLRQLDRLPAKRVLLLDPSESPAESRFAKHLRELGAEIAPFDGFGEFIQEVHYGQRTPEAAFAALTAWLRQDAPAAATARTPRGGLRIMTPEASETPVFFGEGAQLFGICCEPRPGLADRSAPAVIFINTGHHHHIGVNRMAVALGRRLAAQGI